MDSLMTSVSPRWEPSHLLNPASMRSARVFGAAEVSNRGPLDRAAPMIMGTARRKATKHEPRTLDFGFCGDGGVIYTGATYTICGGSGRMTGGLAFIFIPANTQPACQSSTKQRLTMRV